jgi:hypothetical protein
VYPMQNEEYYIYIYIYIYIYHAAQQRNIYSKPVNSNKIKNVWKKYMYITVEVFVKSYFEVKRNTSRVCSFCD